MFDMEGGGGGGGEEKERRSLYTVTYLMPKLATWKTTFTPAMALDKAPSTVKSETLKERKELRGKCLNFYEKKKRKHPRRRDSQSFYLQFFLF